MVRVDKDSVFDQECEVSPKGRCRKKKVEVEGVSVVKKDPKAAEETEKGDVKKVVTKEKLKKLERSKRMSKRVSKKDKLR